MDGEQLSHFRTCLEAELARLEAEIAEIDSQEKISLSEESGENVYRDHMADQGSATFERELDITLEDNVRELLAETLNALSRMDAGVYGVCTSCSAAIPAARLEAVPTASMCIACKERNECR